MGEGPAETAADAGHEEEHHVPPGRMRHQTLTHCPGRAMQAIGRGGSMEIACAHPGPGVGERPRGRPGPGRGQCPAGGRRGAADAPARSEARVAAEETIPESQRTPRRRCQECARSGPGRCRAVRSTRASQRETAGPGWSKRPATPSGGWGRQACALHPAPRGRRRGPDRCLTPATKLPGQAVRLDRRGWRCSAPT